MGASRRPVSGQRRPSRADQPALDRRRALVLDQLLADRPGQRLERVRPAGDAQPGVGAHRAADQRIEAEALVERPQVLVDPEREPHPLDPPLRRARGRPRGRRTARGRRQLGDADDDRLVARVQQPVQHAAAHPGQPVEADAAGAGGTATRGRTSSRTSTPSAAAHSPGLGDQVDVDQERARADDRQPAVGAALAGDPARARSLRALRRLTSASVAAPATNPVAAAAAACTAGSDAGDERLDRSRTSASTGSAVDDLLVLAELDSSELVSALMVDIVTARAVIVHGTTSTDASIRGRGSSAQTARTPAECSMPTSIDVFAKAREHERLEQLEAARELDALPYFRVLEGPTLPVVEMEGSARIMLGSNNYLGLTGDERVKQGALDALNRYGTGLTGSRFLNGTIDLHLELERELAEWLGHRGGARVHHRPPGQPRRARHDPRPRRHGVADSGDHASILDGCILSRREAARRSATTGSTCSSKRSRRRPSDGGGVLVVVDGVFSMEGDVAPLPEIAELCGRFGARLMVDEAHALGVLGARGAGTLRAARRRGPGRPADGDVLQVAGLVRRRDRRARPT